MDRFYALVYNDTNEPATASVSTSNPVIPASSAVSSASSLSHISLTSS